MRNSFDLLNDIFDWCVADEEIMRMLGVTDNTNTDVLKNKLRLECQADEAVTAAEVPLSLTILHALKSWSITGWSIKASFM